MLDQHIQRIEYVIRECAFVVRYTLYKEQLSPNTGYIEGEIHFVDNSRLVYFEFYDLAVNDSGCEKYRYHYMDCNNHLIIRYDNAPHHPDIFSYPHHKHIPSGVVESVEISFTSMFKEIESNILQSI